ncbi:alpha/beta hydrolase [Sphingomonas sp. FW199]|uniref:alpha/beta hydrolase n=1 Tax=Sphingomonas sp. FW199 TaxID=3400217 RepID=UPI003CEA1F46
MDRRAFLSAMASLAVASPVLANPFTKGAATMRRITFKSGADTIVGQIYLPEGASALAPVPAVVVTGAWFTVKEQMSTIYARALARRGYAALAFDFRGFGESGGAIRQREIPADKIADIVAAAAFLKAQPEVDGARVGGLGICASAGYMVAAATESNDLKSIALVAPWLHDAALVETIYGGKDAVARLIEAGRKAEASFKATGRQTFFPGASRTDRTAIMFDVPYYTETTRGLIPAWRNKVDPAFWESWLTFDAMRYAPKLAQPFLIVESDAAALPAGARQFYAKVPGNKRELWLDGISQFDFYDRPSVVASAIDAVADHFARIVPR